MIYININLNVIFFISTNLVLSGTLFFVEVVIPELVDIGLSYHAMHIAM